MCKLKYPSEHVTCLHYKSDRECRFKNNKLSVLQTLTWNSASKNILFFVVSGSVQVSCELFQKKIFAKDDITLFSYREWISVKSLEESEIVTCEFDVPTSACDKLIFSECQLPSDVESDHCPIRIKEPLKMFLDLLIYNMNQKINCEHFHEVMEKEMFFLFKYYYTKEELGYLFHPLSGSSFSFRKGVLDNYHKIKNIDELAAIIGMSRSRFDFQFKEVFNTTPRKFIQKQLALKILFKAGEPDMTAGKLLEAFDFNTAASLCKFCQASFSCSPTELIQYAQEGRNVKVIC